MNVSGCWILGIDYWNSSVSPLQAKFLGWNIRWGEHFAFEQVRRREVILYLILAFSFMINPYTGPDGKEV